MIDEPNQEKKHVKMKFDPTVNLGHILTFVTLVAAGFGAWSALDKRVLVLEAARQTQSLVDKHQDQRQGDQLGTIKETLSDIRASIEKLNEKIDRRSQQLPANNLMTPNPNYYGVQK